MVLNKKVDQLPSIVKHKFETVLHQDDSKNLKNISNPNKFVVTENKDDGKVVPEEKEQPKVSTSQVDGETVNVETVESDQKKEDFSDKQGNVNIFNVVDDGTLPDDSINPSNIENKDIPNIPTQEPTISTELEFESKNGGNEQVNSTWGDMENIAAISEASNGSDSTAQYTQKVHPESVFLRLSNRIKVLYIIYQRYQNFIFLTIVF